MMSDIKKVEVFGDVIQIRWDGNAWVSPHNGQQYSHAPDAMWSELSAYYIACGEDIANDDTIAEIEDHISGMADGESAR